MQLALCDSTYSGLFIALAREMHRPQRPLVLLRLTGWLIILILLGFFLMLALHSNYYIRPSTPAAAAWQQQDSTTTTGGADAVAVAAVSSLLEVSYRPWAEDPECREYVVQFIRRSANGSAVAGSSAAGSGRPRLLLALVSYPGSGSTWTRGIIERLTGYFTGSVYTSKDLVMKGFLGEAVPFNCGCTVAQKTHDFQAVPGPDHAIADERFANSSGAVLIIRNPYDALVSYRNYMQTGNNQTATASASAFAGPEWRKFVLKEIDRWQGTALRWIPRIGSGGVLYYGDLLRDRPNQLRLLARYLGLGQQLDERRLQCVLKHDYTAYKRNSASTSPAAASAGHDDDGRNNKNKRMPDRFDSAMRDVINRAIKNVQAALDTHGYHFDIHSDQSN